MIMPVRIWPTRHFRPSETGNLNSWNIDLMVRNHAWRFPHFRTFKRCSYIGSHFERRGSGKCGASMVECATQNIFPSRTTKMAEQEVYVEKLYRTTLCFHIPVTFFIYDSWHIAVISWLNMHVRLQSFRTRFIKNRNLKKEIYYILAFNIHPS
jgi:hypothetical protein